jgi:hypothetical protein
MEGSLGAGSCGEFWLCEHAEINRRNISLRIPELTRGPEFAPLRVACIRFHSLIIRVSAFGE